MAILPTLRGIECQILINGKPASELRDTDAIPVSHPNRKTAKYQARRTVSTYIESITDQNFAIKLRVGPPVGFKAEGRKKMAYTKIGFHATVGKSCSEEGEEREGKRGEIGMCANCMG